MFSGEVRRMLLQVITSWQVIAVTIVLVIYISIVNYAARLNNRGSRSSHISLIPKVKKKEKKAKAKASPPTTDELDLGEESKE
jgi:hypothetical protein